MRKKTLEIHIKGRVQGVGFRPFINRLAEKFNIKGEVANTDYGVFLKITGDISHLEKFINAIKNEKPPLAIIEKINIKETEYKEYPAFEIIKSFKTGKLELEVLPDVAICNECIKEIFDPSNRRYFYFSTTCINCGPRFTIIESLPYDRENTVFNQFKMCKKCENEYNNIKDRRYHSQPNCCPECGPQIFLYDKNKNLIVKGKDVYKKAGELIETGKIIAVKGIGGYHLVCNALNNQVVKELRRRKKRSNKPFAVMMKDIEMAEKYVFLNEKEKEILTSWQRPVLLCKKLKKDLLKETSPGLNYLGVFLPYTGFYFLLFKFIDFPVVCTSANISDEVVIYKDEEIFQKLKDIADYFVIYNRRIVIHNDDSVGMVVKNKIYLIRRSRGYAPESIKFRYSKKKILGLGALQKNTFAIYKNNKIILSQHIGDLKTVDTFKAYKNAINHFFKLFDFYPDIIVYDLHPEYVNTKYRKELIDKEVEEIGIQHHYAHLLSCLVDNKIMEKEKKFIGIAFDGTGYGIDGNLWGGEFFIFNQREFKRAGHFDYIAMPGGEMVIKQPWRMALSYLYKLYKKEAIKFFNRKETEFILKILENYKGIYTSSAGRLFDGVSALLGICINASYEGEPAILLENTIDINTCNKFEYEIEERNGYYIVKYEKLFAHILDLINKKSKGEIAGMFHNTIADIILNISKKLREEYGINEVVLSGGVFQNRYLLEKSIEILEQNKFKVLIHRYIPANDGGISAGQVLYATNKEKQSIEKF